MSTTINPAPAADRRRLGASTLRVLITAGGTAAVVLVELLLLLSVYHRADSLRRESIVAAELRGVVSAAPALDANGVRLAQRLVTGLHSHSGQATHVRQAVAALTPGATTAAAATDAIALSSHLHNLLASDDEQAAGIYATMLILASFGWMIWFRRLVARHRLLEHQVTEQASMMAAESRLAALGRNSADVIAVCDADSTISLMTPASQAALGIAPETALGTKFSDWVHRDDRERLVGLFALPDRDDQPLSLRLRHADGRHIEVEGTVTNLLADELVAGIVLTFRDVSARRHLEGQLQHQAFHDSLTGLANRQLFADRLGHALERRSAVNESLAVLFCDLDDFKEVNDSRGHGVGDQVLAVIGARVSESIRSGDTAARLGGDEFAVLMEGATLEQAEFAAQRLLEALSEPIDIDGEAIVVGASIGIAQAIPGEMTSEDALRNADVAMYLAKERGKSRIALYSSALHAEALERMQLRADLQRALQQGDELILNFQPTVELSTGRIAGFEALVRWQHPTRGMLPPGLFIPMAEESGLIVPLGSWVLAEACKAAVALQTVALHPTMAVNVSAQQLAKPGFVDEVVRALADAGLASDRLTIEITEGVILADIEAVGPRLNALRALGIRVAIDDFGTGYSSLSYLSHLPVDVLKVDKSFVDRVATDAADASLAEAILAMSRSMNLATVAEGVEDEAQALWLTDAQCSYGQGYLWSRPVEFEKARELVAARVFVMPQVPAQRSA